MAKNNHSIGNAGEFYVLAQLAQRGYIAGKTDDGQTLIDVIATDPETLKSVNIQVKSTAQFTGYWMTGNKARISFGKPLVRIRITKVTYGNSRVLCLPQRGSSGRC